MDGSKFWGFPWFPENSLVCVILRYTVYINDVRFLCQFLAHRPNLMTGSLRSFETAEGQTIWEGQNKLKVLILLWPKLGGSTFTVRVHIFWEDHNIWQNLHRSFDTSELRWRFRKNCVVFSLLRKPRLYRLSKYLNKSKCPW